MSITRRELRRMVLRSFGDLDVCTATANGTSTTFIDADTLVGDSGRYAGRYAYVATGDNAGLIRYVTAYNGSTHTLTFQSALPNATATGDEVELTNAYGIGVKYEAVHAAINYAIRVSRPYAKVADVYEPVDAFDGDGTRTVSLPADWVGVESVHYQNPHTQAWNDVRHAAKLNANGWAIDRANRTLTITGEWGHRVNDRQLRIYGYTLPGPLEDDDDETSLDVEWLIFTATAHLMLDVVRSRAGADWGSQGLYYRDQADRIRTRLSPNLKPSYQAI